MNKAFEQIALIEGMIAAAFVSDDGKLVNWCANSAISQENLTFIGETCRVIMSANRAEQRDAHTGIATFGHRTLLFREGQKGLFLAYLDSPVDMAVLDWFWLKVTPLLAEDGITLD